MPAGLRRFHESRQSHFITFSCLHRQPNFISPETYDLFVQCLEEMRHHFAMHIYGYVVMPEHVHRLVSEPERDTLADAIHYLKLSFANRWRGRRSQVSVQTADANLGHPSFWEKRYYDRNVRRRGGIHCEVAVLASQPGEAGTGQRTGRLEVEQFSALRFAGTRSRSKSNRNGRHGI